MKNQNSILKYIAWIDQKCNLFRSNAGGAIFTDTNYFVFIMNSIKYESNKMKLVNRKIHGKQAWGVADPDQTRPQTVGCCSIYKFALL